MSKLSKRRNDNLIRVGDRVRIVTPLLFVRCGYPLCIADVAKTIDPEIVIDAMVKSGAGTHDRIRRLFEHCHNHPIHRAYRQALNGLALAVMMSKGYGGSERRIYTREEPELLGKIVTVEAKTRCVTGDRYSGCSPVYYGDEAEGPSLENQQHHTIIAFWYGFDSDGAKQIEQIHVEKVKGCDTEEDNNGRDCAYLSPSRKLTLSLV